MYRECQGGGSLVAFVVNLNVKRWHLSNSQKAMLAVEVELQLVEESRHREESSARYTLLPAERAEDAKFPTIVSEISESAHQAAALVGTNGISMKAAKRIVEQAPELKEVVRSGRFRHG